MFEVTVSGTELMASAMSVNTSVYEPVSPVNVKLLKVATPFTRVTDVVPPKVAPTTLTLTWDVAV